MIVENIAAIAPHRATRWPLIMIGAWALGMIFIPILRWTVGDASIPASVGITVVLQVAAVLAVLAGVWGWRRTLLSAAGVALLAWIFEYVGHTTGFPFGDYFYTANLQPQIGGVPLLVPLAWLMMIPPAWAVAQILVPNFARRRWLFIGVAMLAFTAWDLYLDPQMVSWGIWVWPEPGAYTYFGIPWTNYAGWLLVSGLMTTLIRPPHLPIRPMLLIYGITWFLMTFGLLFFWNLPGPALVGGAVMGTILLVSLVAARRRSLL